MSDSPRRLSLQSYDNFAGPLPATTVRQLLPSHDWETDFPLPPHTTHERAKMRVGLFEPPVALLANSTSEGTAQHHQASSTTYSNSLTTSSHPKHPLGLPTPQSLDLSRDSLLLSMENAHPAADEGSSSMMQINASPLQLQIGINSILNFCCQSVTDLSAVLEPVIDANGREKQLGKGTTATVTQMRLLRDCVDGAEEEVAVKHFNVWTTREELTRELRSLHAVRAALNHNNEHSMHSGSRYVMQERGVYRCEGTVCLVMPLMRGDLSLLSLRSSSVPKPILGAVTWMLLQGLQFLHNEAGVMHRDLKPSNLLIGHDGRVCIADFGASTLMLAAKESTSQTFIGSLLYMAPERIRNSRAYTETSDIWSLGVTLLQLVLGEYPFRSVLGDAVVHGSIEAKFWALLDLTEEEARPSDGSSTASKLERLMINFGQHVDEEVLDFVSQCLCLDPHKRPTATTLLSHPWISQSHTTTINGPSPKPEDLVLAFLSAQ